MWPFNKQSEGGAPLWDIRLQNMGDLDFNLSRSPKVKSNGAVGFPIYDFLLVSNSNQMSISHRLGVIAPRQFFSYLLSLGPNFGPPTPTLTPGRFLALLDFVSRATVVAHASVVRISSFVALWNFNMGVNGKNKMWNIWKTADRRAKRTKICAHTVHIWRVLLMPDSLDHSVRFAKFPILRFSKTTPSTFFIRFQPKFIQSIIIRG